MDILNYLIQKAVEYLDTVNWAVAFTSVAVNYLFAKGSDSIRNLKYQTLIGFIPRFWRAMTVSVIVGFTYYKLTEADKLGIINGVLWSHLIYEGAVKILKQKLRL
jgi:hypothetical protein